MKKFKFKLAALLRMKQAVEKEVRQELAQIQALCEAKRVEIDQTGVKIGQWSQYYNDVLRNNRNPAELAITDRHITNLCRYREQLEISLEVLNKKREDVLKQYQEIKRELESIEHLKEKRRAEHREEWMKEEEKISDEMATIRFVRERGLYE